MSLPPGPTAPAFVQQLRWLNARRQQQCLTMYSKKYGDVFTVKTSLYGPLVFFSTPSAIRTIFRGSSEAFEAPAMDPLSKRFFGEHSLMALNGHAHSMQRRLLMPAFHGERMSAYFDAMLESARENVDKWPVGAPLGVLPHMQEITLSVILRGVLGLGPDAGRLRMRPLIERLMASLLRPAAIFATMALPLVGGLTPYARFRRAVEELDAALYFEIRQRRGSEGVDGRADLLSLMLTARYEDGKPMSDEEVRDELITLIVAGFETTAVVLSWSFEKLLTHPEALRRLIAELIEVVGQRPLRPEDLPHLTYLDGCINEAMRLHPLSVIGARITRKDVEIDGIEIPARTCVVPCMYLAHRRPDAYPNPEAFEPERWRNKQPDPASFFPFGGGYRRCIGAEFSLQEIKIVLAHALSRCDLEPTPGPRPAPRAHGVLLAPGGGCPIVVAHKRPDLGTRGV